ncbi:MAG: DNA-binding protein, partial [Firmicutes bacterium HGW-Firmicutes-17]
MLDKIIKTLILTVSLLFCLSGGVSAADVVELNQLVENAEAMDGQTVTVTGEAIGEAMERGDHAWV